MLKAIVAGSAAAVTLAAIYWVYFEYPKVTHAARLAETKSEMTKQQSAGSIILAAMNACGIKRPDIDRSKVQADKYLYDTYLTVITKKAKADTAYCSGEAVRLIDREISGHPEWLK